MVLIQQYLKSNFYLYWKKNLLNWANYPIVILSLVLCVGLCYGLWTYSYIQNIKIKKKRLSQTNNNLRNWTQPPIIQNNLQDRFANIPKFGWIEKSSSIWIVTAPTHKFRGAGQFTGNRCLNAKYCANNNKCSHHATRSLRWMNGRLILFFYLREGSSSYRTKKNFFYY